MSQYDHKGEYITPMAAALLDANNEIAFLRAVIAEAVADAQFAVSSGDGARLDGYYAGAAGQAEDTLAILAKATQNDKGAGA